ERAVGEHVDPDLSAALDVTGHGDTRGLDLTVRHVGRAERLDPVLTERDARAASCLAAAVRTVLLTELHLAGDKHYADAPSGALLSAPASFPRRGPRRPPRSPRAGFFAASSRASSLFVRSPL